MFLWENLWYSPQRLTVVTCLEYLLPSLTHIRFAGNPTSDDSIPSFIPSIYISQLHTPLSSSIKSLAFSLTKSFFNIACLPSSSTHLKLDSSNFGNLPSSIIHLTLALFWLPYWSSPSSSIIQLTASPEIVSSNLIGCNVQPTY